MNILVNIFDSQEPLAAYLFLKQYYQPGDGIIFISTRLDREFVAPYASLFHIPDKLIAVISFHRDEDSYIYERICRRLRAALSTDAHYMVNLAGGTRYSALAVQHVFSQFDAKFYYVQTRENLVVSSFFDNSINDNDDVIEPITYRMSLADYFEIHNLQHDMYSRRHSPTRSYEDSQSIFNAFKSRRLTQSAFRALELLRTHYRGTPNSLSLSSLRKGSVVCAEPLHGIDALLRELNFIPQVADSLQPHEVDYLTGGWFEEYVYHTLATSLDPDEIALSVRISRAGASHDNELDVVFIKANTLFVIECKTGVATDHLFNEIVYKACALKETYLGRAIHSYIFTLKNDYDRHLSQAADAMGIALCDKSILSDPKQIATIFERMRRQAHDF